MLSHLDCARLLQAQYDGVAGIFDYANRIGVVSVALKYYPEFTLVAFEGSYNAPDWFSNFRCRLKVVPGLGGVEEGFYQDMPAVLAALSCRLPKGRPVQICGHSRGGGHAHILRKMLWMVGYAVEAVVFGSPRPGDARFADGLAAVAPCVSYRNYRDFDEQDFVCDVPLFDPFRRGIYVHPEPQTVIDVAAAPGDAWLFLSRHHLGLYILGLQGPAGL